MKIHITILCLLLSLINNFTFAQKKKPSGYLGKRIFVGGSVNYSPNFAGVFEPNRLININGVPKFYMINPVRTGISLGYVTKEYRSLVLDIDFQKFGVSNDLFEYVDFNNSNPIDFEYSFASTTSYRLKFLKSPDHSAPVGSYGGVVAMFVLFDTQIKTKGGQTIDAGSTYDVGIGYTGGVRRVFLDKVMLDISLEYALLLRSLPMRISSDESYEFYAQKQAIIKNSLNNMLTGRVGLYYLL